MTSPPPSPLPEGGTVPVLPLRDLVFFPHMVLPLRVGRPASVAALDAAHPLSGPSTPILLLTQRDPETEEPGPEDLSAVGTLARIRESIQAEGEPRQVVVEGVERVRVEHFLEGRDPCLFARVQPWPLRASAAESGGEGESLERWVRNYVLRHPDLPNALIDTLGPRSDLGPFACRVAGHLVLPAEEKQPLLEAPSLETFLRALVERLEREVELLHIEDRLEREMRSAGEEKALPSLHTSSPEEIPEWEELQEKLRERVLPAAALERAEREVGRLRRIPPASPEAGVIRSYLDWIFDLPWNLPSRDPPDLHRARSVLDSGHWGLEEVKDRILDHIAVLSLVGEMRGPLLCLVGPPGVGKTSLGRSIAHALDRSFVRVSLGGVRDEAEIRGHRRTYVGSLPGRILQGLRRAGTRNPVFLLDEVDKLAQDSHGDPSAALLEVLDPEQNRTFQDHYLELEFDLSEVLFLATANHLSGIPEPLRDRMEVIRIPGYLGTEKRKIAQTFLAPTQLRRHGLSAEPVDFPDDAAHWLIENFTREAGVRDLDRCLARVARKLAREVAEGRRDRAQSVSLDRPLLGRLLGPPPRLRSPRDQGSDRVGVATGLAWTEVGGDLLEVEVSVVPGEGKIQLTGTLGEVMKESAMAAVTFARSRAKALGLRPDFHRDIDVHIHIPEGATPKDGPSAGVTIATALISALVEIPTRTEVAMTGEITLRGRVLPVGGLKEKLVAALRGGLTEVVLPAGNAADLERLPAEITERLTLFAVQGMEEVLQRALGGEFSRLLSSPPPPSVSEEFSA